MRGVEKVSEGTEELEMSASAVIEAGQAIDLGDGYVLVPFRIERVHARVRISSSAGGPLVDGTSATDMVSVGLNCVNIRLPKDDYVKGNPAILRLVVRQLQTYLRDGLEVKNLALSSEEKRGLPSGLTIK